MNKRKKLGFVSIVLIGFTVYFLWMMYQQQIAINSKTKELNSIQAMIDEENINKTKLEAERKLIGSDTYIEKVAREELGMVKSGEKVFIDVNK